MPLKARTPDDSVAPDRRPLSVVTGSEMAAGVVAARATSATTLMRAGNLDRMIVVPRPIVLDRCCQPVPRVRRATR
jgi:hypothetical protein